MRRALAWGMPTRFLLMILAGDDFDEALGVAQIGGAGRRRW
jgi:hypothetical protein